jgi:DNA repair protein RadC
MKASVRIRIPSDAYDLLRSFATRRQEHFLVLTLNAAHEVIRRHTVTVGLVNRTMVHPREVFYPAIKDNAVAIIVAHNHPSGHVDPSAEDNEVTWKLSEAGVILGIPVLDHVIIGRERYYSYLESGSL